jgi:hypothetical protein
MAEVEPVDQSIGDNVIMVWKSSRTAEVREVDGHC